ncbi:MAG TPA: 4-hydroxythreonine-4-phosphate dehydrogenase PdxA [Opitutales bacterium]|nr:4-hydroxythreonine-4-phosphate dehydrogenase PdxA [Opitutales bacterium]
MNGPLERLPIAITCGDPAGVGPDVIQAVLDSDPELASDAVVIGPRHWLDKLQAESGVQALAVGDASFEIMPGLPRIEGAALALDAMRAAAKGCRAGRFRGVVTGPVNKHWLNKAGFSFMGQTEFFAEVWGGEPTMAFVGEKLRVVLATWHIPLREVPDALDAVCLEKAVTRAYELGKLYGATEPRIGVCGLNPHAGEKGLLGKEEIEVMDPVLDRLREKMPGLSPCLPGDTVFFRQLRGEFDVVIAAHHDQGLAALKTLEFDRAVNVTLGLPFVRTSPDHGTAFELAGQGRADPGSFEAAVHVIRELTA